MIYIFCAFETEARALIDKHRLSKRKSGLYTLFTNEEILIFISGMGQENANNAAMHLILNFPAKKDDIFINLGVCAAQSSYRVGNILQIEKLVDEKESHRLKCVSSPVQKVSCFSAKLPQDRPVNEDIAEMEAMSIYNTISQYFAAEHISFLKVVSDNFNPVKLEKQFIISLIQKNIPLIDEHIKIMQGGKQNEQ